MIRPIVGAFLAALMFWSPAKGQTADTGPKFEVASVKPAGPLVPGTDTRIRGGPGTDDPGRIIWPHITLIALVTAAYGVNDDQVSGPDWLNTERCDIVATMPPKTTKDQFHLMLQNLLAERFHLTLHHETRDLPVYELAVAKGGSKMKPSSPDVDGSAAPPVGAMIQGKNDKNGFPVLPPGRTAVAGVNNGVVRGTYRVTMAQFAAGLGTMVNASNGESIMGMGATVPRVVDKTGLTGKFDFTLEFAGSLRTPPYLAATAAAERRDQELPEASAPADAPDLFTALEKQLGLKLEKGKKDSLDMLVIDHVDKAPTGN
jgi:uncharacterized protein (TIGR03435 family)